MMLQAEILDLVEHLRHGDDSQAGFSEHIRRVVDMAGSLENQYNQLVIDHLELKRSLALVPPEFKNFSSASVEEFPRAMSYNILRIRTDLPEWRMHVSEQDKFLFFSKSKAGKVMRKPGKLCAGKPISRLPEKSANGSMKLLTN